MLRTKRDVRSETALASLLAELGDGLILPSSCEEDGRDERPPLRCDDVTKGKAERSAVHGESGIRDVNTSGRPGRFGRVEPLWRR